MKVRPMRFAAVAAASLALGLGALAQAQGPVDGDSLGKKPAAQKAAAATPDSTAPNSTKGKVVYEKICVPCHKSDGTGGVKTVPTANASRNFRDPTFWKGKTDAQLRAAVENGFPKSGMLSYKGQLTSEEIRNVVAYMRARFQPKK